MSIWLYCVLMGGAILVRAGPEGGFRPESIYNSVRAVVGPRRRAGWRRPAPDSSGARS